MERFYDKSPLAKKDNDDETIKAGAKLLETLFSEEKDAVTAEMRQRISSIALANAYGGGERRKLLDAKAHVDACRTSLEQAGVKLTDDLGDGELTVALHKLYWKVLEKKIEGKKLGHHQINASLNDSVQSAFVSAAKDLVKDVNKLGAKLDTELRKLVEGTFHVVLRGDAETYRKEFGEEGMKTLATSVADDVLLSYKGKLDEIKRNFLASPETYTKKTANVENIAMSFFDEAGPDKLFTNDNITYVFRNSIDERNAAVLSWIYNPTGPEGKSSLEVDLVADEKRRVLAKESNVAKPASSLPDNELTNIVNQAVKEVLARAERFSAMYSVGGRDAFKTRINNEIRAIVDKHVESHAKFREAFVKDALKILPKYDDALKTETRRGKEVAADKMNAVLDEISRSKEPPKIKGFAVAFEGMLNQMVKTKVDVKVAEFMAYSKKVTSIYEKCLPAFEAKIREMHEDLKKAGATDDDIRHLEEKLMPIFRQKFDTDIQLNVDTYLKKEIATKYAELKADEWAYPMLNALRDMDLKSKMGILMVFDKIGMKDLLTNSTATENATKDVIATALKGTEAQKVLSKARKAAMTLAVYGKDAPGVEPESARKAIEEFHQLVRDAVLGVKKAVKEEEFNEEEVEPAVKLFELWIEKYNLPAIHVSSEDFKQGTLKDAAVAHFKKRVAAIQKEIAEKGSASEPLLSANYIKEFVMFLNKIGRKVIYTAMQEDLVNRRMPEIMKSQKFHAAYEYPTEVNAAFTSAVALNITGLQEHLLSAMRRAESNLNLKIVSLEDMYRWKDMATEELEKQIADDGPVLEQYHQQAYSRAEMMGVIDLDFVSGDYAIDQYLSDALKKHFKDVDIRDEKVVTPEFMKKQKATVNDMVDYLKGILKARIDEHKKMYKDEAMNNPRLKETHVRFPGTKQLELMFRLEAEDIVSAIADKKNKDAYASFFHEIEKKVEKSKAKKA